MTRALGAVVYLAGSRWDGVAGTDRRLASALGEFVQVLWVDPPRSIFRHLTSRVRERTRAPGGLSCVSPGVSRLQVLSPPGPSRPGVRWVTSRIVAARIRSVIRSAGLDVSAVVLASPARYFPLGVTGVRVLYVTDDWPAGAEMMGLSLHRVKADLERNVADADVVAAVTSELAERVELAHAATTEILPNGCDPARDCALPTAGRAAAAGVVGQLNERLDLDVLEAVRQGGTPLILIGPRTERDADTRRALDELLAADGVTWHDEVPSAELPAHLARMGVGLTPYADTPFNRASFPLKTLEYLASGLPVVSTDLPAARWLDTDLIEVALTPQDFAARVRDILAAPADPGQRSRRFAFAQGHTWRARAMRLLAIVERESRAESDAESFAGGTVGGRPHPPTRAASSPRHVGGDSTASRNGSASLRRRS